MVTRDEARSASSGPGPHAEVAAHGADEIVKVLAAHGSEAGHYSVLGPDPWRVIWNDDHSGFVSFLEEGRCVLSWRSPVAAPEDQGELVGRLIDYARASDRHLLAVVVNAATHAAGVAKGMIGTWIGTECYLDLPTWSLEGGRRQKVRWARSHASRLGFTWRESYPLRDGHDFAELARIEELWKEERPERRTDSFLRNSFTELAHLRRYFVCQGPSGIVASVSCTPISARGWYLQDPVRATDAPRGALEGAMSLALETFRDEGYAVASNGPLPFWRPDGATETTQPLGILGTRVQRYFDSRYRFQHINQFRSKFVADSVSALYVLRSHRLVTPGVARSLTRLLTQPAR
ncbi:MAG: DUF2156 domain-containing protein [Acidobacteriota bacterium]|nr:DUF2156 domain-containing protein [Acidobacteriota bacterium]